MVARATAPNSVGPGSVFPDAAKWDFQDGLSGKPVLLLTADSRPMHFSRESNGFASVLDSPCVPAYNRVGLFLVLPQRTIVYVTSEISPCYD
jgi:hypothetical protein